MRDWKREMKKTRKWRLENDNKRAREGKNHIGKERENRKIMVRERKWNSTEKWWSERVKW